MATDERKIIYSLKYTGLTRRIRADNHCQSRKATTEIAQALEILESDLGNHVLVQPLT